MKKKVNTNARKTCKCKRKKNASVKDKKGSVQKHECKKCTCKKKKVPKKQVIKTKKSGQKKTSTKVKKENKKARQGC